VLCASRLKGESSHCPRSPPSPLAVLARGASRSQPSSQQVEISWNGFVMLVNKSADFYLLDKRYKRLVLRTAATYKKGTGDTSNIQRVSRGLSAAVDLALNLCGGCPRPCATASRAECAIRVIKFPRILVSISSVSCRRACYDVNILYPISFTCGEASKEQASVWEPRLQYRRVFALSTIEGLSPRTTYRQVQQPPREMAGEAESYTLEADAIQFPRSIRKISEQ